MRSEFNVSSVSGLVCALMAEFRAECEAEGVMAMAAIGADGEPLEMANTH